MTSTILALKKAPLSLATWTSLSMNLSARDKLIKIIQYVARILYWYYQSMNSGERTLTILQKVKEITSLSRRSFRMFRSIIHINRIYNAVSELIDENCSSRLDDILISSVGIFEDVLLVLYFGYENYLFFVNTKILTIRSESETAIRNSSGLVSLVGNFVRVLGVCLRINRTSYSSKMAKKRLDYYSKRVQMQLTVKEEQRRIKIALERASLIDYEGEEEGMIVNRERQVSELSSLLDGFEHLHDRLEEVDGEIEEDDDEDGNDSSRGRSSDNSGKRNRSSDEGAYGGMAHGWQRIGSRGIIEGMEDSDGEKDRNDNDASKNKVNLENNLTKTVQDILGSNLGISQKQLSEMKYNGVDVFSEGDRSGRSTEQSHRSLDHFGNKIIEDKLTKVGTEFDVELDLLSRLMREEQDRLEQDLYGIEEEKRSLCSDAIVVSESLKRVKSQH